MYVKSFCRRNYPYKEKKRKVKESKVNIYILEEEEERNACG
jgi:hypothetical protein